MERPLITLMMIAFNQEQYIQYAVQAAFMQTYSPLEILLSDDRSSDSTYTIMEEMVDTYHGPHRVRLNRNENNLGIGGHVNRLMEMAEGELIVVAAGDDISVPHRVEKIWTEYLCSEGKARSIYSNLIVIDELGQLQETVHIPVERKGDDVESRIRAMSACGCSHAWHRSVFDVFGPMLPDTVCEDKAIAFRSCLLGEIRHIEEPLVHYRRHTGNITARRTENLHRETIVAHLAETLRRRLVTFRNYQRDLLKSEAIRTLSSKDQVEFGHYIHQQICLLELEFAFVRGTFRERLQVIGRGRSKQVGLSQIGKWCIRLVYPYVLNRTKKKLIKGMS
ncbi:MAG: glycosyltransferase [Sedimentisphaerales bacterium]|nr:glycosyltransferase [Sedimentisphaerales bacterium]